MVDAFDFADYGGDKAQAERKQLRPGIYLCKIVNATLETTEKGNRLTLDIDIAKGEFEGYFTPRDTRVYGWKRAAQFIRYVTYAGENNFTKGFSIFKGHVEEYNPTYTFDRKANERQFIGLMCGFEFDEEEFVGRDGNVINYVRVKYSVGLKKLRKNVTPAVAQETLLSGAEEIPDEDVPF